MRYPQIIIYESDNLLSQILAPITSENQWIIRECRRAGTCLTMLREPRPSVFLVKLGTRLTEECTLVQEAHWVAPACGIVAVCDAKLDSAEQRKELAGLAYELGATYVVFPPLEKQLIEDAVSGIMEAKLRQFSNGWIPHA